MQMLNYILYMSYMKTLARYVNTGMLTPVACGQMPDQVIHLLTCASL